MHRRTHRSLVHKPCVSAPRPRYNVAIVSLAPARSRTRCFCIFLQLNLLSLSAVRHAKIAFSLLLASDYERIRRRRVHDSLLAVMPEPSDDKYPGILPPPPGETVDLLHPESIAYRLILTCILCLAITLIFCLIRLYTARFIVRKTYLDDCERRSTFPAC